MAIGDYTKTVWVSGDLITSSLLNNNENKVEELDIDLSTASQITLRKTSGIFQTGTGVDENQTEHTTPVSYKQGQVELKVKGRTVVNLADFGDCESTAGWNTSGVMVTTDNSNEYEGTNCLKIALAAGEVTGYIYKYILSLLDTSKHYLISAHLKNGNLSTNGMLMFINCVGDAGYIYGTYITGTSYMRDGILLQPSDFDSATQVTLYFKAFGAENEYAYADAIMINEISASEYAQGASALLEKYNWHLGTKSVPSGYVKSIGKNLFNINSKLLYRAGYSQNCAVIDNKIQVVQL